MLRLFAFLAALAIAGPALAQAPDQFQSVPSRPRPPPAPPAPVPSAKPSRPPIEAIDTNGIAGVWTLSWPNQTRNTMALTQASGNAVSGHYTNDAGNDCPVTGSFWSEQNNFALLVDCPGMKIQLMGTLPFPRHNAEGTYVLNNTSSDKFSMTK